MGYVTHVAQHDHRGEPTRTPGRLRVGVWCLGAYGVNVYDGRIVGCTLYIPSHPWVLGDLVKTRMTLGTAGSKSLSTSHVMHDYMNQSTFGIPAL